MSIFDDIPLTPPRFPHAAPVAAPEVPTNDPHYQLRRKTIIDNWQKAFEVSRETNKPPKYEVQQVESGNLILAGILLYNSIPDGNHTTRLATFLDRMDVGGYRMGRTRMGTPWASVFIRNVQYSMSKYVPSNVRFPELTLLGLAVRPNMHLVWEFINRDMRQRDFVDRQRANGCRVNMLMQHTGEQMLVVEYQQFACTIAMRELEAYFNRRFDRNFVQYLEAEQRRGPFGRSPIPDFDGDVTVLMEE